MDHYRAALKSAVQQNDIAFMELRELTEEAFPANGALFGELIHPNHMGHRLIASELLKLLAARGGLKDLRIPVMSP